jgi:hypothetical protein
VNNCPCSRESWKPTLAISRWSLRGCNACWPGRPDCRRHRAPSAAAARARIAARCVVGEGQPAGGVDVGRLEYGIDLVLGLQTLGDDLELQVADRAEQQRAAGEVLEDLDRSLFAELLQAFLQLLALQRIAQARARKSSGEK